MKEVSNPITYIIKEFKSSGMGGGRQTHEGGDIYMIMTYLHSHMAETSTTL